MNFRFRHILALVAVVTLAHPDHSNAQARLQSQFVMPSAAPTSTEPTPYQYGSYEDRKSVTLAVIYSLVLPGMGELYADNFRSGKYYLIAEAGLWVTYGGLRMQGNWLREDARTFATQHAGASFDGKDEQFDVNIGNFLNEEEYDQAKLRNRESELRYSGAAYTWLWDSDANRSSFKDLRIRSDEIYNNSKFVVGLLVVNRILSAFNAGRAATTFNRNLRAESDWRLRAYPDGGLLSAHGWKLEFQREF